MTDERRVNIMSTKAYLQSLSIFDFLTWAKKEYFLIKIEKGAVGEMDPVELQIFIAGALAMRKYVLEVVP